MTLTFKRSEERPKMTIAPLVSIHESERDIILEAEMVGLKKEDVKLEVKGDELTISGVRNEPEIGKDYTAIYKERWPYEYSRTFVLGNEVDKEKISAKYDKGVLTLTIPKSEESQPKKIEIK